MWVVKTTGKSRVYDAKIKILNQKQNYSKFIKAKKKKLNIF